MALTGFAVGDRVRCIYTGAVGVVTEVRFNRDTDDSVVSTHTLKPWMPN